MRVYKCFLHGVFVAVSILDGPSLPLHKRNDPLYIDAIDEMRWTQSRGLPSKEAAAWLQDVGQAECMYRRMSLPLVVSSLLPAGELGVRIVVNKCWEGGEEDK
jgi:hypothetical protein